MRDGVQRVQFSVATEGMKGEDAWGWGREGDGAIPVICQ